MTVHVRRIGTVTVLDVDGRITEEDGADTYRETVQRLVSQNQLKLVVNFQSVPYIDSAALGEIVRAYTTVTRRGGALKLLALTARVRHLFELTRLWSVFEHFETEGAAIESFDSPLIGPM
jgi:anti-sigma B factor antagonist